MKLKSIDMDSYHKRVYNAAYWVLIDAIRWARLDVFGTYLDNNENSVRLAPQDVPIHADIALMRLKTSAKQFLHSTTVEEEVTGIYFRTLFHTLFEDNDEEE